MEPNKVTIQIPVQTALHTLNASGQAASTPKLNPNAPDTVSVELDQETFAKLHAATANAMRTTGIFMDDGE
jgi:hypothetical protein